MNRSLTVGAASAAVLLVSSASASAVILPAQAEVRGVKVGETKAQVQRKLGRGHYGASLLTYQHLKLQFQFSHGRVDQITVFQGSGERTPSGVGTGSPLRKVRKIHGIVCDVDSGGGITTGTCDLTISGHVTEFTIEVGKVDEITVS
jgi:uncharacterized protein with FMN-binding domain